jgi:hypothetical protein
VLPHPRGNSGIAGRRLFSPSAGLSGEGRRLAASGAGAGGGAAGSQSNTNDATVRLTVLNLSFPILLLAASLSIAFIRSIYSGGFDNVRLRHKMDPSIIDMYRQQVGKLGGSRAAMTKVYSYLEESLSSPRGTGKAAMGSLRKSLSQKVRRLPRFGVQRVSQKVRHPSPRLLSQQSRLPRGSLFARKHSWYNNAHVGVKLRSDEMMMSCAG